MSHCNASQIAILFHNTTIHIMQQLLRYGFPNNLHNTTITWASSGPHLIIYVDIEDVVVYLFLFNQTTVYLCGRNISC